MSRDQPFGPYILHERINVGGMAEVFRAAERATGRVVAVKRLLPSLADDGDFVSMFRDEAAIASQLDHPGITRIYDVGQIGRALYIAMEYVAGRDARAIFDRHVEKKTRLPRDVAIGVVRAVATALAYAHARTDAAGRPLGIVHRDVSLQNLLVGLNGDVKITDFGIAKAAGRLTRTEAGTIKGKYGYMSPEHARGLAVDMRADVFSLGICLWELLTGERLFTSATDVGVIEKVRACEIMPPSAALRHQKGAELPREIDAIVMKALAKDASDRYASASDFFADLTAFAQTEGSLADRERIARTMRETFPDLEALASESVQERRNMAENKGGSDLDVFEGLTKKPAAAKPSFPPPVPPPSGQRGLPPPARSTKSTMLGIAPPPGMSGPLPPPVSSPKMPQAPAPSRPPLPPPSRAMNSVGPARPTGQLPAVVAPPSRPPSGVGSLPIVAPPARSAAPPAVVPPPNRTIPGPLAVSNAAPPVDMDWDDEDEKTNIYDKEETAQALASLKAPLPAAGLPPPSMPKPTPAAGVPPASARGLGSAAALAAGSGGMAAAPMPAPLPPPQPITAPPSHGMGVPVAALPAPAPLPSRMEPTQVVQAAKSGKGGLIAGVAIALVAVAAGAFFVLAPKRGTLIVVAKSGGREVKSAQVFVDEKKVCESLPCRAPDIDKGTRSVKVVAPGFEPGTELVAVRSGEESPVTIELARGQRDSGDSASSAPQVKAGTGFRVSGPAQVKVSLDGKELGPLPQEVRDATPGEHKVKLYASERYTPDERTITFAENEMKDLGAVKLKVVKGKATLTLETLGAIVTLVSGAERKAVRTFPISLDIDTSKTWVIEANKSGFVDFKQPITFDDGEAEKTFSIALVERGKPKPKDDDDKPVAPKKDDDKPVAAKTNDDDKPKKDDGKAAADSGQATLSINSIPPSSCILDGRPLGSTPKAGVSVSAGTHTVVFVHPEMGRKSASVTVKAGESRSVGVRFLASHAAQRGRSIARARMFHERFRCHENSWISCAHAFRVTTFRRPSSRRFPA